ncbi:MAG: Uma2 family endonuclease [Cytophagaceae bacterium]|nr:Uma2 family endonuclease [Gemmatimonadaceae bacterium]
MPVAPSKWTVEMLRALPEDGNRYEVIDGVLLVNPAPSRPHQRALRELMVPMFAYLKGSELEVLWAPYAITFSPRTELQPDLLVTTIASGKHEGDYDGAGLRLVVEALSPSTARNDRYRKRLEYLARGVPEYWIVDVPSRLVERWMPGNVEPEVLLETISWQPFADRPPLTVDLPQLFSVVEG